MSAFLVFVGYVSYSYWAIGLRGNIPRIEKLWFTESHVQLNPNVTFTIFLTVKNTGNVYATINCSSILYNGKLANAYGTYASTASAGRPGLNPDESTLVTLHLPARPGSSWVEGTTVEIIIQTNRGTIYSKYVVLESS